MRFSSTAALAVAVLATDAAAWSWSQSYSNHWRWGGDGGKYGNGNGNGNGVSTTCNGQQPAQPTEVVVEQPAVYTTIVEVPAQETTVVTVPEVEESPAPAATTAASTGSTDGSKPSGTDQENALAAHNKARAEVNAADLVWDSDLAAQAQKYAEEIAAKNSMVHSGVDGQGENLYAGSYSNPYTSACDLWIAEKSKYSGQPIDGNYGTYGHYTQVIWGKTQKLGMGAAKGSDGSTYVVARYYPAGNMLGSTPSS